MIFGQLPSAGRSRPKKISSARTIRRREAQNVRLPMRLSPDEIKLVVFVLLALLVGATVKHYRSHRPMPARPPAAQVMPVARAAVDYE